MGRRISDEDIERVRDAVSIVDVISAYIPLKRSGRSFKGVCPFHGDNDPSLHVYPDKQIFKCFGCQKAGTVFSFLMAIDNMEFHEAVTAMADQAGIAIDTGPEATREASERDAYLNVMRAAAFHFRGNLKDHAGAAGANYLENRGITRASIDKFFLGYALDSWDGLLKQLRGEFGEARLEETGLIASARSGRRYDRFRHRIMFPISDARGRVVAFGGRAMPDADDETPKYVNSPETSLYRKSRVLYGLHLAREADLREEGVIIVEGYTDVILLHQVGVTNAVAACGTALTPDHVRLLKRYTSKVNLVFDGDAAGVRAMDRGLDLLMSEDMDLTVAILPEGLDPADFALKNGGDAFREVLRNGQDLLDFKLDVVCSRRDMRSATGVSAAADEMLDLLRRVPNPVRRDVLLQRVSDRLGTDEKALRGRLSQAPARRPGPRGGAFETPAEESAAPSGPPTARSRHEGRLVEALLGDPDLISRARSEVAPDRLDEPTLRRALERIFDLFDRHGRVTLAQVIVTRPEGMLERVSNRLLEQDREGIRPDYACLLDEALAGLKATDRRTRRRELMAELRRAESSGDLEAKRRILRELQEDARACAGPSA